MIHTTQKEMVSSDDGNSLDSLQVPYYIEAEGKRFNQQGNLNLGAVWPEDPRYQQQGKRIKFRTNPEHSIEAPFDPDNLLFFNVNDVNSAVNELEEACLSNTYKHLILFVGAGGTIASAFNNTGQLTPGLDVQALLNEVSPSKLREVKVVGTNFPTPFDSSQAHPIFTGEIVQFISCVYAKLSQAARFKFSGVAIAYGTDTLPGSGAEIAFSLGANCPFSVGMVSAQRATEYRRNDVADNMNQMILALVEFHGQRRIGMFTVTGGTGGDLISLVSAQKQSDQNVTIFNSLTPPLLRGIDFGIHGIQLPEVHRRPDFFYPLINRRSNCVVSFEPRMGDDPDLYRILLRGLRDSKITIRGVNLVAFGSFTAHEHIQKVFEKEARDQGIIVFASNSVSGGTSEHNYKSGITHDKNGFYPAQMSSVALLAKANLANAVYQDNEPFLHLINNVNLCGEMRLEYWNRIRAQSSVRQCDLQENGMPDPTHNTGTPAAFFDFTELSAPKRPTDSELH